METFLVFLFMGLVLLLSLIPPVTETLLKKDTLKQSSWAHGLKNDELKKEKSLLEESITSLSKREYRRYLACFVEYNKRFRPFNWWKANADTLSDEELEKAYKKYFRYLSLIDFQDSVCEAICRFLREQLQKRSMK